MYLAPSVRKLIPLAWLVWVALLGSLLRFQAVWPIEGLAYGHWLHAHSHLAFLGWLFNAFYVHFTEGLQGKSETDAGRLFFWLQIPLLGMAVSFPLSGYSAASIAFSTAHTALAAVFAWRWLGVWQKCFDGNWLRTVRWAFVVMLISQIGPFVVAYAQLTQQAELYAQALHFYLYFQYAGWFSLAVLAILQKQFGLAQAWLPVLAGNALLYYLLAMWQAAWWPLIVELLFWVVAAVYLLHAEKTLAKRGWQKIAALNRPLWLLALTGFAIKCLLEAISLVPGLMSWAETIRPLRIGYLHTYFLGFHSGFLLLLLPKTSRFAWWWIGGSLLTWLLLLGWTVWVGFMSNALAPALLVAALLLFIGALKALKGQLKQQKEG